MLKRLFIILAMVGMFIISIMAFTIPNDPYEIIPAMSVASFDKPLWFCIIIGYGFFYLMILWSIYDKLEQRRLRQRKIA